VEEGLDAALVTGASNALFVIHKGVIRVIVEKLTGAAPALGEPPLGGSIGLSKVDDGSWIVGRRGSNPPALDEQAA